MKPSVVTDADAGVGVGWCGVGSFGVSFRPPRTPLRGATGARRGAGEGAAAARTSRLRPRSSPIKKGLRATPRTRSPSASPLRALDAASSASRSMFSELRARSDAVSFGYSPRPPAEPLRLLAGEHPRREGGLFTSAPLRAAPAPPSLHPADTATASPGTNEVNDGTMPKADLAAPCACDAAGASPSPPAPRALSAGQDAKWSWYGGVRALRDSHVRLVLRQLRHVARLNRALDRAAALDRGFSNQGGPATIKH
ncbi:hypothetical protein K1T71_000547 [Dendrolimus kikuchii]|uniref:Uncharacterized protein n=1 Tax=Dendrolimus kikuchii TaxID=765133 RepID=A0ACC1DJH4_9NEOP|nr:hypothetical protein K1T71_000547 [Dendrolimus kikuchii]